MKTSLVPLYDEGTYILNDTRDTYEIGKGKNNNTETWTTNLHMTIARLPGHRRKSRQIATKNYMGDQAIKIRDEDTNTLSMWVVWI